MTIEEVKQILTYLKNQFPQSFNHLQSDEDARMFVAIWHDILKEENPHLVQVAVKKLVAENTTGFAPNIGMIRQKMKDIAGLKPLEADEAWTQVRRLWSNISSERPDEIREDWEKLPSSVKRIYSPADLIELAFHTTSHDIEAFEKPRFMSAYKSIADNEMDNLLTYKSITQVALETNGRLMIEGDKELHG